MMWTRFLFASLLLLADLAAVQASEFDRAADTLERDGVVATATGILDDPDVASPLAVLCDEERHVRRSRSTVIPLPTSADRGSLRLFHPRPFSRAPPRFA